MMMGMDFDKHHGGDGQVHQPTGDGPECCNPDSLTSENRREQEQRVGLRIVEVPVELSPAPGVFIDITPEVLKTPQGRARVNQAVKEFEDATANVANAAADFIDDYGADIGFMLAGFIRNHGGDGGEYAGAPEELQALRDAIAIRRAKQEAFLRAMANQPPTLPGELDRPLDVDGFARRSERH